MSRAELIDSAVSFLRDPSAASSPLAQRIAFLESKGLTGPEIGVALQRAQGEAAGGWQGQGPRRGEYERDWRDWFVMAVVGGGVGWLGVALARKFLLPHLQPPTDTQLEAARKELEAKYDDAALLLAELKATTDGIATSVEEQREAVEKELKELREAVKEVREGEKKREDRMNDVAEQVDKITDELPKLLERQSSAQATSLTDLQTELKSLKSLILTRRGPSGVGGSTSPVSSGVGGSGIGGGTTPLGSPFPGSGGGSRGIPAWQMKQPAPAAAAANGDSSTSEAKREEGATRDEEGIVVPPTPEPTSE